MDGRRSSRRETIDDPLTEDEAETTLIPEHIVDQASQRLFVVSLFVLLQCWKIYDILLVKADAFALNSASHVGASVHESFTTLNNFTFVLKYAFVDGVFLWILPVLNIPLLTFSPAFTLFITIGINAFTFLLASNKALPFLSAMVLPVWNALSKNKELTIMGESTTYKNVVNINEHFKGRYTIQYLPESSVKMNPFHFDSMCIESSSESSFFPRAIQMPIEFNTTTDVDFIQISHISPDNVVLTKNYSSSDVRKLHKRDYSHLSRYLNYVYEDERVFYLEVELSQPGTYSINSVLDSDGMKIRPYKSDFTVSLCPSVSFVYPGLELIYSGYKCVNPMANTEIDWELPLISTFGVSPVTAEIAAILNGKTINTFNATVFKEDTDIQGLQWLESHEITRNGLEQEILRNPSLFQKLKAGKLEFQILSVSDKLNNKRTYNPASKDKDVNFAIELKESVHVGLFDKQPGHPLLINDSKTLHFQSNRALLRESTFVVQYQGENSSLRENMTISYANFEEYKKGFTVTKPGTYSLIDGHDSYCPCIFTQTNNIVVNSPPAPTVEIRGEPITDKCVGTVGFEFDLLFTGNPPFEVSYNVYKNISGILRPILSERGLKDHIKTSAKESYKFQYKPRQEGSYVLVFKEARDKYYKDRPVKISEKENTFATYFHQRSKFHYFDGSSSEELSVCKGGVAEVPVHFEGNFPFSFKYLVADSSGKVIVTEEVKNHFLDNFIIKTPQFTKGGKYKVSLVEVSDKLDCPVDIPEFEVSVFARAEAPSVEFEKSSVREILEGETISIPLKFQNVANSQSNKITYSISDLSNSTISQKFVIKGTSALQLKNEGIYRLESFENGGCPGIIENEDLSVKVIYKPKPNLTVVTSDNQIISRGIVSLDSCCESIQKSVQLRLEGQKPFVIPYVIRYPNGKVQSSTISIDDNKVTVPLSTDGEGEYKYEFSDIYDSLYTQRVISRLPDLSKKIVAEYKVLGSPKFAVGSQYIQLCETTVIKSTKIPVQIPVSFEGQYPFTIIGTIRKKENNEEESFQISDINVNEINMMDVELKHAFSVGEHIIQFTEVIDANGCRQSRLNSHNTVLISITKVPSISKRGNQEYHCVGDHVAYNMSGVSPFTVFYNFNGQTRKTELGFEFERLASKPGELAIIALQDSSATLCLVNFTTDENTYNSLKWRVHDLPSVEISHGDSIIENLNEGDQTEITFKFTGTPPFEVTYVRTLGEEEGRHKRRRGSREGHHAQRRVVDTTTIRNISAYEYTEVVGLEGTYDAIRVSDAYCSASRDVNEIL